MAVPRSESERLRDSFADVLRHQALEASQLAAQAGDDPDLREAVGEMLERVQKTARALNLHGVEQAAADAARSVGDGQGGGALEPLLAMCRALDPTAEVLRPILVVGASLPPSPDPLVRVVPTLDALLAEARREAPLAVVVPAAELPALPPEDPALAGVPRYAWGEGDDIPCRLGAARLGAAGYFAAPLDLRALGARLRARALGASEPDRILLVGAPDAVTVAWVRALAGQPAEITVLRSRDALLASLDDVDPALVVLADPRAAELSQVLRGHPDWWDLPRVVVTDDPPAGLVELLLPATLPPDRLRVQALALLERARQEREARAQDRSTGVLPRAALLRAAEREIAMARRARQPLAVARIDVDEPATLKRAHGSAAVGAAMRLLGRAVREVVRTTDVVGRVGEHGFGVLLPGATAAVVRGRLDEVQRRFVALAAKDPRLAGVTATAGLADTEESPDHLFQRADRDRLRARRG